MSAPSAAAAISVSPGPANAAIRSCTNGQWWRGRVALSWPPERVPTLMLGAHKKLGRITEALIPQIGEPISRFAQQFEMPPKIENSGTKSYDLPDSVPRGVEFRVFGEHHENGRKKELSSQRHRLAAQDFGYR